MPAVEVAVRGLEQIQMNLVRIHAFLAQHPMSATDRHRVDRYFDAFASDLTGLEEYLRCMPGGAAGGGVSESNQPFDASAPKQRF